MPKNFYSLGYNTASELDLKMVSLNINDREYHAVDFDSDELNLSSWWTPSMPTNIRCKFAIKLSEIREDCCLSKNDELFLTLYSYCSSNKLQHHGKPVPVNNEIDVEANLIIPQSEIAGDLNLIALLTTRFDDTSTRKIGAPVISNSRLLIKTWKIYLSGSRTQANVVCLDFSSDPSRAKAMWQIKINDNIDMDSWMTTQHSSVLRIEVNKIYEDYIQQPQFQVPMMTDLVMLALNNAISDDDRLTYLQNDDIAEGSWAKFVKSMFQNIFSPGQISIKQKWKEEQDQIRTRVQHLMSSNLEIR